MRPCAAYSIRPTSARPPPDLRQADEQDEPLGYPPDRLDHWAGELKAIARKREIFAFVISGHKVANPAAAPALLQRLQNTPVTSYITGSKLRHSSWIRRFRSRISGVRSMAW